MRMQARHLGLRVDLEPAGQALGDEGGDVGLSEAAQQQIVLRRLDHRVDGGQAPVFICAMQSSIHG